MIIVIYNGQNGWKSNKTSGSLRQIGFKFNPDSNLDFPDEIFWSIFGSICELTKLNTTSSCKITE